MHYNENVSLTLSINDPKKLYLLPTKGTSDSAGWDLATPVDLDINSEAAYMLDLNLIVVIPKGFVGLIVPRSSYGSRGLQLRNTVGVIDSDYRGSILLNLTSSIPLKIKAGERIAQLMIVPCLSAGATSITVLPKDHLPTTERGSGGFGSTGH